VDLIPITDVTTNLEKSAKKADFPWRFVENFYKARELLMRNIVVE